MGVFEDGDVAQLGEHRLCKAGVRGSSPLVSTRRPASAGFFYAPSLTGGAPQLLKENTLDTSSRCKQLHFQIDPMRSLTPFACRYLFLVFLSVYRLDIAREFVLDSQLLMTGCHLDAHIQF